MGKTTIIVDEGVAEALRELANCEERARLWASGILEAESCRSATQLAYSEAIHAGVTATNRWRQLRSVVALEKLAHRCTEPPTVLLAEEPDLLAGFELDKAGLLVADLRDAGRAIRTASTLCNGRLSTAVRQVADVIGRLTDDDIPF